MWIILNLSQGMLTQEDGTLICFDTKEEAASFVEGIKQVHPELYPEGEEIQFLEMPI